jgi:acetamidase/formamidase
VARALPSPDHGLLPPTHAGIFDNSKAPVLTMQSGKTVTVEVATHHAAHDYAKMIKGDPALEAIYDWQMGQSLLEKAVPKTPGSGVHIITGPIEVEGAEVGDVLQVDILASASAPTLRSSRATSSAWATRTAPSTPARVATSTSP